MPAKTGTKTPTTKLNPTIAPAYRNDKWGYGSIISKEVNAEGIANLQKLQLGGKLLVKLAKKKTVNGHDQFFIEVIPPQDSQQQSPRTTESEI